MKDETEGVRREADPREALEILLSAQRSLRSRFDDFRRALDRRDEEAYRLALADFQRCLVSWTEAEEKALLPAVLRAQILGRDPQRELRLQWVQVRELTRYLLDQITARAPIADTLGLAENLARRFASHQSEMESVYCPAAAAWLTPDALTILKDAAPD